MNEPLYPPILPTSYTRYEAALIAGFIIQHRAGVLSALATMSRPETASAPEWRDPVLSYYRRSEQFTRYLLDQIGYTVPEDENYAEEPILPPETIDQLRRLGVVLSENQP